ncbi:MAG TPA: hypothetical protein VGP44_13145 [Gemmatimonadales bacterium]|nr:hypothetical protein [Gemmatimonadales bacterium]
MPPLHAPRNDGHVILPLPPQATETGESIRAYWITTCALRETALQHQNYGHAAAYSERLDWLCEAYNDIKAAAHAPRP